MIEAIGEPTQSALVIKVPEAESTVSRWRQLYDPGAAWPIPAHITVLYPFLSPDALDQATLARLAEVIGTIKAFEFELDRISQFDNRVLYLAPNPADRFIALTAAVADVWPDHQPYAGVFATVIPHLTIAHTNRGASFDAIRSRVREDLPIPGRVETVSLMAGTLEPNSWETVGDFHLG